MLMEAASTVSADQKQAQEMLKVRSVAYSRPQLGWTTERLCVGCALAPLFYIRSFLSECSVAEGPHSERAPCDTAESAPRVGPTLPGGAPKRTQTHMSAHARTRPRTRESVREFALSHICTRLCAHRCARKEACRLWRRSTSYSPQRTRTGTGSSRSMSCGRRCVSSVSH